MRVLSDKNTNKGAPWPNSSGHLLRITCHGSSCTQSAYPWMLSVCVGRRYFNPPTKKTWYISAWHNKINRWYDCVATFISETVPTKQNSRKTCTQTVFALFLSSFWKLATCHGFHAEIWLLKGQHVGWQTWCEIKSALDTITRT